MCIKNIGIWMTFCWFQIRSTISKEYFASQYRRFKAEVLNRTNR